MTNVIFIVGRFKGISKDDKNQFVLNIETPKSEPNEDGIYENDKLNFIISEEKAKLINEYCENNDLMGIKGKLSSLNEEMIAIGCKITFLNSKNK